MTFYCARDRAHIYTFWVKVRGVPKRAIGKVGQDPAVVDIAAGELRRYRQALSRERFREFARAIGLFSHGVGIGSFVYLRRVFEHLVEAARKNAATAGKLDDDVFNSPRLH